MYTVSQVVEVLISILKYFMQILSRYMYMYILRMLSQLSLTKPLSLAYILVIDSDGFSHA